MNNWTEVTIYTTSEGIDIISGFLTVHGIKGHVIEDAKDFCEFLEGTTTHWDYVDDSLMELKEKESNVKFYLSDNLQGIESFNQIKAALEGQRALNEGIDLGRLTIETSNVNEEDWSTAWKKYYHPTKIGKRLVVVPCWEKYTLANNEVQVTLDPGMAFGTGTHETTRLCMQLLEDCVKEDTTMLDIGTGSGILAITALLLGAKQAVGVDIDELSVKVAQENADLNHVGEKIELVCGDLTEKISGTYDVVCANIVADVIIRLSKDVKNFMHQNSILLVSGIIDERCDEVIAALQQANLNIVEKITENGWVAMKCSL
ncbi:50S ribosomal protein L11 methyltransferase [Paludicola sp. MB14-C6]|uniref:50S ribosomal protein L11 methyltransferase n=1 Tax=Paludihabitans sp. MB14-C6 TaxID=3070656 RepID=UPI0027DDC34B|nr:50S ribosomal protein L11 methyltransferase [Paludicola sp. MB14-C6]WMJ22140.1 50S ribosomal protein L11 methyltransferase [Paludicola sp. MB14-C6]